MWRLAVARKSPRQPKPTGGGGCFSHAAKCVTMQIHHLNCGTMCPFGGRLWDGFSPVLRPARLVCHCLLIETEIGLVLVDTGFGTRDVAQPQRLSRLFRIANRIRLREEDTALRQLEALGYKAADVRHIVLTHLDFDHAGGIEDFPEASVHVFGAELEAAQSRRGLLDCGRYRPMQWSPDVAWQRYSLEGERWFGFYCVRELVGVPADILLVPLAGHTFGHCGIAVRAPEGWLLHAGDAYFFRGEMDLGEYRCTPMLRLYQRLIAAANRPRLANLERLRELKRAHGRDIRLFCAHDAKEFEEFSQTGVQPVSTAIGQGGDAAIQIAHAFGPRGGSTETLFGGNDEKQHKR
jgi:glyoxylase-like metal-dependent hydrolase (beta-lactamase superfamily II)